MVRLIHRLPTTMGVVGASCFNCDMTKLGNTLRISMALVALMLAGCSAPETAAQSSTPAPTSAPATTKPAPTPATKSRAEQIDDVYIDILRTNNPGLTVADPESMITIGKGFCSMYDGGAEPSDINSYILTAAGPGYTVKELSSMHGAAVAAYCQEHMDKLGQ